MESLEAKLLLAADFGDAPVSYSTLLVGDGARHEAVGPLLGAIRTVEADGQPTGGADADGGDDGVTIGGLRGGQLDATAVVLVTGATISAYLDAWIDFNGDGSFDSIGERVATRVAVQNGANDLLFTVPVDASAGTTYARFRISTAGVAGPGGAAPDGEVEDYAISISPPRSSAGQLGPAVRLNTPEVARTAEMLVEDADGDGDLDVYTVSGDSSEPQNPTYETVFGIYLHENIGDGQYRTRLLAPVEGGWAYGLVRRDFTGDGRLDFVVGCGWPDKIDLFEQTVDGMYVRRSLSASGPLTIIEAGDLDGDVDLDVMGADTFNERILWYENDGTGVFVEQMLDDSPTYLEHALLADLDSDGDQDIVYSASFASPSAGVPMELAWLRNDGGGAFERATQPMASIPYHKLTAGGDFDGDGDVDLFATRGESVVWLENDGAQSFTVNALDAGPSFQLRGTARDMDGDGDLDVVAASYGAVPSGSLLVLYRGDGAGNFVREELDVEVVSPGRMQVVDMDGDGRLDVVLADSDVHTVSSYRQTAAGTFEEQVLLTALSGSFQAVDLDQDGDLDFVTRVQRPYYDTHALWWYEQIGPGKFLIREIIEELRGGGATPIDLDSDGDLDLLASYSDTLSWFENDGAQQFTKRSLYSGIDRLNTYAPADYDSDGDYDIVIGNGTTGVTFSSVRLLENDGNQHFTMRQLTTTNHYASRVAPGDLDGDGDLDVFVGGTNQVAISWFEQVAGGGLVRHVIDPTSMFVDAIDLADLDADGDLDLVADSLYYRNEGNRTFTKFVLRSTQPKLLGHRFGDLDGDGLLDIVASVITHINYQPLYENRFVAYRNLGAAGFAPMDLQTGLRHASQAELADIDGDGDLDGIFVDIVLGEFWFQENVPSVSLDESPWTIVEELGADRVFTFRRGGDSSGELSIQFAIAGTASYGGDYTISGAMVAGTTGTVIFPAGVDEVQVLFHAVDDHLVEPDETIVLQLSSPAGYSLAGSGAATVTIESLDYLGDYGDAPPSYGTMLLTDGARHLGVGPRLGSLRTAELNGAPTADATGDPGDDGVVVVPLRSGDAASTWQVLVSDAPAGAVLDAWIDLNGDGAWDEATERVARGHAVVSGFNTLTFATPVTAAIGTTFARVRVSTAGTSTAYGPADDGEVEDYAVTISPPRVASGEFALPTTLSTNFSSIGDIAPADFDGDGDSDFVFTHQSSNRVYWLENRGAETPMARELVSTAAPQRVVAADIDGDGLLDLLTSSGTGGGVISWHRRAADGTFATQPVQTVSSVIDVAASDLDGDGDVDILVATGQSLLWYVNIGQEVFTPVDLQVAATSLEAVDLNGDGRIDLVAATATEVVLLTQSTVGAFSATTLGAFTGAIDVATADFNGDGERDVWVASTAAAVILERQGGTYAPHHLVAGPWGRQNTLADIEGDGDVDLVSGRPAALASGGVAWYENQGGFSFAPRPLRGVTGMPSATSVVDFDGNGQLDLIVGTTSPASLVVALAAPAVSVSATTTAFGETGGATLDLRFTRRDDLSAPLNVAVAIGGIAGFGADYVVAGAASWSDSVGEVMFPVGVSEVIVTLTAVNDSLVELDEPLTVSIPDAGGQVPLTPGKVALTLTSDELGGNFGDGPAPYPTTLSDRGAAHQPYGPKLGPARSFASDATPAPLADTDADDDGVAWEGLQVGSADAAFLVDVRDAPAGGGVDVWLDLDGDGAWYSAAEHIVAARAVVEGIERLAFEIPAWAAAGLTFARVRISTIGSQSPIGLAADGEVEDYAVTIEPPTATTPLFGLGGVIAATTPRGGALSLAPMDFDRDGDVDLMASGTSSSLAWYENQGTAGFVPRVIDSQASGSFNQIAPVDYDRDGDIDLVAVASNTLVWFENVDGATFTRHTLNNKMLINRFVIGEFDKAGRPQIVASYYAGGNVANLALMTPDGTGGLAPVVIGSFASTSAINTRFAAVDYDRDGDLDVVAAWVVAGTAASNIVLLANDGQGTFAAQPLGSSTTGSVVDLLPSDIDGDGDQDLVTTLLAAPAETTRLAWWEQGANGTLTSHLIDSPHRFGAPTLADINGDGFVDVVAARASAGAIPPLPNYAQFLVWLGGPGGTFTYQLDPALPPLRGGALVAAGDLDQDGDLDLVSVDSAGNFAWYRSVHATPGDYNRDGAVDTADYAVWFFRRGATSGVGLQADGNGDGLVDAGDYAVWREHLPSTAPAVDVNADGAIDGDDLQGWQAGFGLDGPSGSAMPGDANEDGAVDGSDFLAWQRAVESSTLLAATIEMMKVPTRAGHTSALLDHALEVYEATPLDDADLYWLAAAPIGYTPASGLSAARISGRIEQPNGYQRTKATDTAPPHPVTQAPYDTVDFVFHPIVGDQKDETARSAEIWPELVSRFCQPTDSFLSSRSVDEPAASPLTNTRE